MTERFKECLKFVLKWEGGWTPPQKGDPNPTNYGVTQRVYDAWRKRKGLPKRDVRLITQTEVSQIYWELYWSPMGCPSLPPPLDLVAFDSGVNCGVGRAKEWLKQADGSWQKLIQLRRVYYHQLVKRKPVMRKFLKGWLNRLSDLERVAGLQFQAVYR